MEEEGGEAVEEEVGEEEEGEAPPRKGRSKLIAIIAILVAAALAFTAVYFLVLSNAPPNAQFTTSAVDTHLYVNAENTTDPDDSISSFVWNWGDASPVSSGNLIRADHLYAQPGPYTITLTVTDSRGAFRTATRTVTLIILPTPFFIARQSGMTTSLDATQSTASQGNTIASYQWNFGDGTTDNTNQPVLAHTYSTPDRYVVTLNVTQANGISNSVSHYVSVNTTTVDVLANQFFVSGCPYKNYWNLRFRTYGDVILPPNQIPCTDFYPWVLYKNSPTTNPSWVYSLYRFDARVTNNLGYSVWQPVVLPVFNYSVAPAANSYIHMNFTFDYLSNTSIAYWGKTLWPVNPKYSDGFGYLVIGNLTMDLQESKRVFGVVASTPGQAQTWWYTNTKYGGSNVGPLENSMGVWLDQEGNGKYDIFNGFQWFYESDIADLNATVAADGTTTVHFFLDGWGYDVLMARWFYWGNASYHDAVCVAGQGTCTKTQPYGAIQPKGWMPFETCWCENASADLNITNRLNLDFQATSEYWFSAVGNPGPDGQYNTSDDLSGWSFAPTLMDYVPRFGSGLTGQSSYLNSELQWYESSTATVTSPGSYAYGQTFEYMVTPARWNMSLGNTLTLVMPRFKVPFYNPLASSWDSVNHIGKYTTFLSTLTLRDAAVSPKVPGQGYYLWDDRGKVLSMAAPSGFVWPNANQAPLDSAPYFEFAPESTGG